MCHIACFTQTKPGAVVERSRYRRFVDRMWMNQTPSTGKRSMWTTRRNHWTSKNNVTIAIIQKSRHRCLKMGNLLLMVPSISIINKNVAASIDRRQPHSSAAMCGAATSKRHCFRAVRHNAAPAYQRPHPQQPSLRSHRCDHALQSCRHSGNHGRPRRPAAHRATRHP